MTAQTDNRRKHLTILKNLYSGDSVLVGMAGRAQNKFEEPEQEAFTAFQVDVGALFLELKDELDQGLEDMADVFPEETDPRKWGFDEWLQFEVAVKDHEFEEIYRTMAKCEDNIRLVWDVIEDRLNIS